MKEEVKCGFSRLIKPYILFSALGEIAYLIVEGFKGEITIDRLFVVPIKEIIVLGAPSGNLALWFLPTLFLTRVLFQLLKKAQIRNWMEIFFFYSVALLFHYIPIEKPLLLGNLAMGMTCFAMGDVLRSAHKDKRCVAVCFVIYVFFIAVGCTNIGVRGNDFVNDSVYPFWIVFALSSIVCANYIGEKGMGHRIFSYFEIVGRNSMDVYVWHWIFIEVSCCIFSVMTSNVLFLFAGTALFTYVMSFIVVRYRLKNK